MEGTDICVIPTLVVLFSTDLGFLFIPSLNVQLMEGGKNSEVMMLIRIRQIDTVFLLLLVGCWSV